MLLSFGSWNISINYHILSSICIELYLLVTLFIQGIWGSTLILSLYFVYMWHWPSLMDSGPCISLSCIMFESSSSCSSEMEAVYMLEIEVQASKSPKKGCIHWYTTIVYMIYKAKKIDAGVWRLKYVVYGWYTDWYTWKRAKIWPIYNDIRLLYTQVFRSKNK